MLLVYSKKLISWKVLASLGKVLGSDLAFTGAEGLYVGIGSFTSNGIKRKIDLIKFKACIWGW